MSRIVRWEFWLCVLLAAEILCFGLLNPGFWDVSSILYSMNDFIYIGLAAVPMTFVIITGGIDVSVGSVMGLTSITVGMLWSSGVNIWVAVALALLVGIAAGAVNGSLVAWTNVQPLVITLGGMFLFSGIALVVSGGSNAQGYEGISGFPDSFVQLANDSILGLPNLLLLFLGSTVCFGVLLHLTRYGRNVYLVGINAKTARYSGVMTRWTVLGTYMLSGLGAAIGGIVLSSYFGSARSDLGAEAVLPVITAVVLGGTSITGGRGTVFGTAVASILIGLMQYGLQMIDLSSQQTTIVIGLMLILTVAIRQFQWDKWKSALRKYRQANT
ncbi:ABC transporter permease [Brevibacillus sp. B_LB10_24]|uniref:ABC transporter permease n=1 Tax=Brevibacillus sp. B_LB10_24 TaxID=3380645 RepID=UPI0038B78210